MIVWMICCKNGQDLNKLWVCDWVVMQFDLLIPRPSSRPPFWLKNSHTMVLDPFLARNSHIRVKSPKQWNDRFQNVRFSNCTPSPIIASFGELVQFILKPFTHQLPKRRLEGFDSFITGTIETFIFCRNSICVLDKCFQWKGQEKNTSDGY